MKEIIIFAGYAFAMIICIFFASICYSLGFLVLANFSGLLCGMILIIFAEYTFIFISRLKVNKYVYKVRTKIKSILPEEIGYYEFMIILISMSIIAMILLSTPFFLTLYKFFLSMILGMVCLLVFNLFF